MIIGIDASQANKPQRTGTEWYAFYILKEWIQSKAFQGHTVRLYVPSPLLKDFGRLPSNWEVHTLIWPPKIFWSQLRLSFELLVHRIDLLFIPSHAIPFIHPKKTLTTIHDIGFEISPELYSKKSIVNLPSTALQHIISICVRICTLGKYGANELDYQKFSIRYALKHAIRIFTVSRFSKKEIEQKFPYHPKIVVAYNGIRHDEFYYPYPQDKIHEIRKKYALPSLYMLSIGRVEKKKNTLATIKIFEQIILEEPKIQLKLVVAGGWGFGFEEIKEYVQNHKLSEKINFLGWVPQNDLPPLLAGASLFTFFSSYEGFGVPLMQSLAIGTPVVASDLDVFHELSSGSALLCCPKNTKKCARVCLWALQTPKSELVERGVQTAKHFTWEKTSAVIRDNIIEVIAKNA
jgi:glycosyltransferase involved in cell wall biosynthesis